MDEIEVIFDGDGDGLRVTYLRGSYLLLVEAVSPKQRDIGGPLALHLSIPLHSRDDGALSGMSNIHLTYARGPAVRVALVPFLGLDVLLLQVRQELTGRRLSKERIVSPDELAADGNKVVLPRPSFAEARRSMHQAMQGTLRIDRSVIERFEQDHTYVASPLELHQQWVKELGLPIHVCDSRLDVVYVTGELGSGWCASPAPDHEDVGEALRHCVSPDFWGKLGLVARELGASLKEPMATWAREAPAFRRHRNKVVPAESAPTGA
jgi:hypothetical protein